MCSLQGVSSQLALLQMRRAYTVVLDLAGAALLLKCTRMQIQGQAGNCLRSRTALGVHVFPTLHRAVYSLLGRCNRSFRSHHYRAVSPSAPTPSPLFHR